MKLTFEQTADKLMENYQIDRLESKITSSVLHIVFVHKDETYIKITASSFLSNSGPNYMQTTHGVIIFQGVHLWNETVDGDTSSHFAEFHDAMEHKLMLLNSKYHADVLKDFGKL